MRRVLHSGRSRELILVGSVIAVVFGAQCRSAENHTAAVDALFADWNRPDSPGCGVGVSRNGSIVIQHGYGMANIERRIPIGPDTAFDVASIAKPFTAMSILLLADEGRLSLDHEVWRYVPEWVNRSDRVTLRHLIAHTAGLRDVFLLTELMPPAPPGRDVNDHLLSILARQRDVNFAPGSEFSYNNGGYNLLATIVERVGGLPFHEFVSQHIFVPLGMRQSTFRDGPVVLRPDQALGYHQDDGGVQLAREGGADTSGIVGNSGLTTTVGDLLRWADNLADVRVGARASMSAMQTPVALANGGTSPYGLGLEVGSDRGLKTVGHGGGDRGIAAYLIGYPERRVSVAVLCNVDNLANRIGGLARRVAAIFMEDAASASDSTAPAAPLAISVPADELAGKTGLYHDSATDTFGRIHVRDGKLLASADAGEGPADSVELVPVASDRFVVPGTPITVEFVSPSEGTPQQIRVIGAGPAPVVSVRVQTDWTPVSSDLRAFAGQYASSDLNVTYTIVIRPAGLAVQIPGRDEIALQPQFPDAFYGGLVDLIRFDRDTRGRGTGFRINRFTARNLLFERVK